jgi:hypothetical protein
MHPIVRRITELHVVVVSIIIFIVISLVLAAFSRFAMGMADLTIPLIAGILAGCVYFAYRTVFRR